MATSKVDWFGEEIKLLIKDAKAEIVEAVAFQIEGQIKANIVANDQVDTGFLLNSTYVVLPDSDTYGDTWRDGRYKSRKSGQVVKQERAPKASLEGDADAAVVVGANYAIYQDIKNSFILKAAEQVAGQRTEAEIERVARDKDLRE